MERLIEQSLSKTMDGPEGLSDITEKSEESHKSKE